MKDLLRIYRRYILTAILLACIVPAVNLLFILTILGRDKYYNTDLTSDKWSLNRLSEALTEGSGGYELSEEAALALDKQYRFAMLIDENGDVVWSRHLPEEIPLHYSLTDIASMTRWYLKDYPVRVWKHEEALFVAGSEKDSLAKYDFWISLNSIRNFPSNLAAYLLCNLLLILSLSLIFGWRFYASLKSVAQGIDELHLQRPLNLPERGITSTLSRRLNDVSLLLFRQKTALDKRDNARTEWISGVSHDIRTPLSLIIGHADSLEQNPALDAASRQEAASIRENSLQIRNLIADLNLTSKLEYDAYPLRLTDCSPASMLRSLAAWHINNGLSDSYSIELNTALELEGITISGDPDLLFRAFSNLTGNSIRHNPEGCQLQIDAKPLSDRVELRFSDTGKGIPLSVIKALYRSDTVSARAPFPERTKAAAKNAAASSPAPHVMGLRIVKQIIEAHQGQIEFVIDRDVCRTIKLTLPLSR